jgi:uncharacterized protein (DUF1330 family)
MATTSVNPTRERMEAFAREATDTKPIVMLNLLKFRERAEYAEHLRGEHAGDSGRAAYTRYSKAVVPLLWEVGGQLLWMGNARAGVIVPDGESWDDVALVHYPSRGAFLRMVTSPAYEAIVHHRTAALHDSRLVEVRATWLPSIVLGAARALFRAKALVKPAIRQRAMGAASPFEKLASR